VVKVVAKVKEKEIRKTAKKPNIVVIMCDQLRYDALGCNGNPVLQTPNIDQLAARGMSFCHAYTPNPLCVPARISFTTGCYSHRAANGSKDNNGIIREGFPLLGEELAARGYETYAIGKLHYLPYQPPGKPRTQHGLQHVELAESGRIIGKYDPSGGTPGLEDYHDYLHTVGWGGYTRSHGLGNNDIFAAGSPIPKEHYVDTWIAERVIAHMDAHVQAQPDKPFFMWASFPKPHSPYDPPHPFDKLYDPRELPEPIGDAALLKEQGLDLMLKDHYQYMWNYLSPEARKVIKSHYYGLIALQDQLVGRIVDCLKRNGKLDDTILVFTSDHGDMMGDYGLFFKKTFYDGSVKVPMIISWPGVIPEKSISDELVGLQDILPTLLSLSGEPLERDVDGEDLSPVLLEGKPVRPYYVSQCLQGKTMQCYMLKTKQWKYIYHEYGGIEELYDELGDPAELHNLAASNESAVQEIKQILRVQLLDWCLQNEDNAMIVNGDLIITAKGSQSEIKDNPSMFGRRYY
jgi:arylsulfatase